MAETEKRVLPPVPPADAPAESKQEPFLSRWSRLKEETRQAPPQRPPEGPADPKGPAPELPALDKLTFDSDYRAFFHPKVDEDVRRAALKKLFADPRFNVMDGLDVYIDDYSKSDPIPPAMLASLKQAQKILEWAKEDEEQRKKEAALEASAHPELAAPVAPSPSEIGFEEEAPAAVPAAPTDKRSDSPLGG